MVQFEAVVFRGGYDKGGDVAVVIELRFGDGAVRVFDRFKATQIIVTVLSGFVVRSGDAGDLTSTDGVIIVKGDDAVAGFDLLGTASVVVGKGGR